MIRIADLILGIRMRLGDNRPERQKYSDPEILDAINSALAHLSEELLAFARVWVIPMRSGVGRYELPGDFLRLISVDYQGVTIPDHEVTSLEYRARHGVTGGVSLDMQTIHFFPADTIKDGEKAEIYYHYYETIDAEDETIALPHIAKEAIVFYALSVLYQNPVMQDGLNRSDYYRTHFDAELVALRSRVRKNQQSRSIRSRHIKV